MNFLSSVLIPMLYFMSLYYFSAGLKLDSIKYVVFDKARETLPPKNSLQLLLKLAHDRFFFGPILDVGLKLSDVIETRFFRVRNDNFLCRRIGSNLANSPVVFVPMPTKHHVELLHEWVHLPPFFFSVV